MCIHVRQFCRNPQPSPALTQHLGPPWPQRFPKFSKAIARAGYERPEAWFEPAGRMGWGQLGSHSHHTSTLSTENQKIKNKDENIMTP